MNNLRGYSYGYNSWHIKETFPRSQRRGNKTAKCMADTGNYCYNQRCGYKNMEGRASITASIRVRWKNPLEYRLLEDYWWCGDTFSRQELLPATLNCWPSEKSMSLPPDGDTMTRKRWTAIEGHFQAASICIRILSSQGGATGNIVMEPMQQPAWNPVAHDIVKKGKELHTLWINDAFCASPPPYIPRNVTLSVPLHLSISTP